MTKKKVRSVKVDFLMIKNNWQQQIAFRQGQSTPGFGNQTPWEFLQGRLLITVADRGQPKVCLSMRPLQRNLVFQRFFIIWLTKWTHGFRWNASFHFSPQTVSSPGQYKKEDPSTREFALQRSHEQTTFGLSSVSNRDHVVQTLIAIGPRAPEYLGLKGKKKCS